ncbi:secreted alpha-amylase [Gloeophyllum trabeum ATCC 11539]|uniref:Alpha-amylase n=1 Tax=Gloeophyllum trabeum (strain ATCC 11539 / FP-39264 / Madison 617) TaxID=670483 RepID=S7RKD8_GLOTA|nr:secreted alpha-amylase [Gloeophyllum trabeum ATCC 11539]EPQ53124.1 secreted alpha-amylase [Gloeophyllum trabeum ATCC 11539]
MFAVCLLGVVALAVLVNASPIALAPRGPSGDKTVIVQMFEWSWDSIASECTNFLGPAGEALYRVSSFPILTLVKATALYRVNAYQYFTDYTQAKDLQASPAQETITGDQWWTDYQPVSYTLTGKRGDRASYQNMIDTCHAAGVRIIADAVLNHMAGVESGTGTGGTSFTHYNYPNLYQYQDFHHCGSAGDDIANYDNRTEVQTCELTNLADLNTESDYVKGKLADYVNDLLSLGVDGLRLDAAKHIAADSLADITSRFTGSPYITSETIYGAGEPIQPSEYTGIGDAQEFRYTSTLQGAFTSNGISGLQDLDNQGWVAGDKANVFVANHDTERNGNSLNYKSSNNAYVLATIFSLAHPYGTPTVLSSYEFSDTDAGAPNSGAGTCSGTGGENGWLCQHRWIAFAGMVGFRNTVGSAEITNWVSPGNQQIAFGRGTNGFVIINNQNSEWSGTFTTSLAAGTYCDVISGGVSSGACSGTSITVASDGTFSATVGAYDALAIHTGATA